MTSWIDLINMLAAVSGLVIAVLGLILARSVPFLERENRRFFTGLFVLLIAYVFSTLSSSFFLTLPWTGAPTLSRISIFCESMFSSLLMPMLTYYLLRCAGEDWRKNAVFSAASVLWLVYFTLLVITQFTTAIYYVTPENVYHRGPWYPLLLVGPVLLMLLNLAALLRRRAALNRRQRLAFSLYLLIPLACMLVQMVAYGLLMIVIGSTVAAMCLFTFILRDQMDRFMEQQAELANQRASIMVLQMRPHFICNTLMSIYYLCSQDPRKAQQVTLDFTSYLRRNFTAIAVAGTIPFPEELEHTRAYLAVEQTRFEGMLFVEIDTPHTGFRIPPLTLQPIVENSVKHGVSPGMQPLYLSVLTRETPDGSEIIVEDTGPGFAQTDDNEPHVALANIRERLALLCGGTLSIEPRAAGGTRVTLHIPFDRKEDR